MFPIALQRMKGQMIGDYAFNGCSGLTGDLTIPNSVTSIGKHAFSSCFKLKEVTIGSGVAYIDGKAFANCEELNSIISLAIKAPIINNDSFLNIATGGNLIIPNGATGYNSWMATGGYFLGYYNWTMQTAN